MGPEMDERILPLGSWIPANLDALLAMPEGRACTVLHGDYRLDNLFFDHDGEVTVLDWQIVTKGFGGYDFGYFVSQSLSVEARRTHVNDLAALYLHELAQQGVSYDEADFWYDVHRTFIFCLFYPISLMLNDLSNERTVALVKEMARRSMSAIIDSGALALVQGTYNGA
jgi:aminoglycoside phosphotransferase (APT) family kinase protein